MSANVGASIPSWQIHQGHALEVLRTLPAGHFQCCVTSPPYYGLRDYKSEPLVWGGDSECVHVWGDESVMRGSAQMQGASSQRVGRANVGEQSMRGHSYGAYCSCGAWRGALGLEPTPELFVEHLVSVFREVRRVLRDDGTLWLNIGDSYASGGHGGGGSFMEMRGGVGSAASAAWAHRKDARGWRSPPSGLKHKDIVGIPWRVAFALQADGWYLRQDIIWAKGISFCETYAGTTMPESVTDRCTKAHEYLFLLTKSPNYYWDAEAIKERGVFAAGTRGGKASAARAGEDGVINSRPTGYAEYSGMRNVRSVWAINPEPFDGEFCTACRRFFDGTTKREIRVTSETVEGSERQVRWCPCGRSDAWLSHFATFPMALVTPIIKVATSEYGACAQCGTPYDRVVRRRSSDGRQAVVLAKQKTAVGDDGAPLGWDHQRVGSPTTGSGVKPADTDGVTIRSVRAIDGFLSVETVGWRPSCKCGVNQLTPCVVLDPFAGSGTTVFTALRFGRSVVGVELNPDYADMARARVMDDAPLFNGAADEMVGT